MKIKKFECVNETTTDLKLKEFEKLFNGIWYDILLVVRLNVEVREEGHYQLYCDLRSPIKNDTYTMFKKLFDLLDATGCTFNYYNSFLNIQIYDIDLLIEKMKLL